MDDGCQVTAIAHMILYVNWTNNSIFYFRSNF